MCACVTERQRNRKKSVCEVGAPEFVKERSDVDGESEEVECKGIMNDSSVMGLIE